MQELKPEKSLNANNWPYRVQTINIYDLNNMTFVENTTQIFKVNFKYADEDPLKYSIIQCNTLVAGNTFTGKLYTYNTDDDMQAEAIVYIADDSAPSSAQTHKVCKKVIDCVLPNGEIGKSVVYYDGVTEASVYVMESDYNDIESLKPGDVFMFNTDDNGYLSSVSIKITMREIKSGSRGKFTNQGAWWGDANKLIVGSIDPNTADGMLLINTNTGSGSTIIPAPVNQNTVIFKYVYDADGEFLEMDYGNLMDLEPNTTVVAKTSNGTLTRLIVGNKVNTE